MGVGSWIRQCATQRVISLALRRKAPALIPTSGDRAKDNDCYAVYLLDETGEARFLVMNIEGTQVQGKWSHDSKTFTEEKVIATSQLPDFTVYIQHYYRTWTFYSIGIWQFLRYRWSRWPWIRVTFDRLLQSRFNKKELARQARMEVLEYVLAETMKDRKFQTHPTTLLTHLYSVRWVHRPDNDELINYYTFMLDALKDSGDLEVTQHHGYKLAPKALNTVSAFVQEERRHGDNYKIQRGIFWLTIALMFVGLVQAGAAAYEQWLKPPEIFTGNLGNQPISLTRH
ncbi:hypothetical protein [Brucella pseudogrignonensis]|uniref:hypothetical protein n=1 Tax=Brucella pseudogrignonensis TaxID=419475 RepID=UPI000CFD5F15|nr:hypothetical protein [Brucella pseudogrignonensis]MQP40440.1 hypothetical protein [Ochrobactrum sp. MYb237]PQZ39514.1 hypothetical protein CQ059_23385 [Brucella pseudogrignonensis]PRA40983.1 hypothetical protein CQ063_10650 [Brucella pseudogrignonensis]PRA69809.1 hypothetical protein CQ055_10535 [Brucella pseudogrignonensis]